jgi:gas vesicle protein
MEMETGTSNGGSTLLAFLLGAAAGAGIALLMAPKTGDEVRGKIKDLSKDAMDKTKEYARTMQDKAKTMMEQGKSVMEQGKEQAQQAFGQVSEAAREKMEQSKTPLS